jgi:hypothetical protein
MVINPVQQTSMTDPAVTPQGHLAAYGLATDNSGGFTKSFTEHCLIIGLVMVRADLTYQQGLPKKFQRGTRENFYWPSFAHLGEQPVYRKEIYCVGSAVSGAPNQDDEVFGYNERFAEYRYFPSQITGKFRSRDGVDSIGNSIVYSGRLDWWHLSQAFDTKPVLGSTFISENPPLDRVQAVIYKCDVLDRCRHTESRVLSIIFKGDSYGLPR